MPNILSYNTTRSKCLSDLPNETTAPEYSNKMNVDDDDGGTKRGDVWNFGLLAMELFYGWNILYGRFKMLVLGIKYELEKIKRNRKQKAAFGGFNIGRKLILGCFKGGSNKMPPPREKKMPEKLMEVVAACLSDDPAQRPTTKQLLEYQLFRQNIPSKSSFEKIKKACKTKEARWLI